MPAIDSASLDTLFFKARTNSFYQPKPVEPALLRRLYDLFKWAPTTMNTSPARFRFVVSKDAKEKLRPALSPGNLDKTMAAPATVIVAYDLEFYNNLPKLFPNNANAKGLFEGKADHIQTTALRNGSLQGAYMILAARALGLDAGPMSGFNNAVVDAAFFPDGKVKSNFLCNLGHGDPAKLMPRNPRLDFDEACQII